MGRWHVSDPVSSLAADWSVYRYGFNNPLIYVDPLGLYESRAAARRERRREKREARKKGEKYSGARIVKNSEGRFDLRYKGSDGYKTQNADGSITVGAVASEGSSNSRNPIEIVSEGPVAEMGLTLSVFGGGLEMAGSAHSSYLYQQGYRLGVSGNYQLQGRNLSLFGNQPATAWTTPISGLRSAGKVVGKLGTVAGLFALGLDAIHYSQGKLSGNRMGYRLGGTMGSIYLASQFGGPYGAAAGVIFATGEAGYDFIDRGTGKSMFSIMSASMPNY